MADRNWTSAAGAWLVAIPAVGGTAVSIANYLNPESGIAGEPGTVLVIASTLLLALFGWVMAGGGRQAVLFRAFIVVSAVLNIAGTAFAGYLLHSWTLLILMLISLVGWFLHLLTRTRTAA